jgi:hypothetical protein
MSKSTAKPIAMPALSKCGVASSGLGPASNWNARSDDITEKKPIPMFAAVNIEGIR